MTVIALGTFDGVHRGHKKIIDAVVAYAKKNGLTPTAITFDPHPQQLIIPERGLKLLTTLEERKELLHDLGIKRIYVLKFNRSIQKLSPEEFTRKILINKLKAKHVFVGYDFAFGWGRMGQAHKLKEVGNRSGFDVSIITPVKSGSHPIKSRKIREELSWGSFNQAIKLLGHPYHIDGKIVKGSGRGKSLGFPTINLKVEKEKLIPSYGVYAGSVKLGKRKYKAAVNIGSRPSFGPGEVLVEAHLLRFKGNVYGRRATLYLQTKLRSEKHFVDLEKLKAQIKKDVAKVSCTVL